MNNYILNATILSSLVYNAPTSINIPGLSLVNIINNEKSDTHGVIMVDNLNKTLYLCFCGTIDEKNVFTDIKFIQRKTTISGYDVSIHDGFLKSFESIKDSILTFPFNNYKDYFVVVCGHSLGGALAIISAVYLTIPNNVYVVTCGCPKVGDSKFVDLFNKRINLSYRFIYCDDVVPSIPTINYKQVNTEIRLDSNGNQIKSYNIWTRFISWLKTRKNLSLKLYIIDDHFMAGYISAATIWTSKLG